MPQIISIIANKINILIILPNKCKFEVKNMANFTLHKSEYTFENWNFPLANK